MGRVVVVTGGSSGIGRATAQRFADLGDDVIIASRRAGELQDPPDVTTSTFGSLKFVACDVTSEDSCRTLFDTVTSQYGRLDVAINNAGINPPKKLLHEYSIDEWSKTVDTNLTGLWMCMKNELRIMYEQRSGCIVNMSSIAGAIGYAQSGLLTATKHGVIGLTRNAAVDYGAFGIRINSICPGPVRTPMLDAALESRGPGASDWFLDRIPLGRFGTTEDVAKAIVWLSSEDASFVSGAQLFIDGGWTAQ